MFEFMLEAMVERHSENLKFFIFHSQKKKLYKSGNKIRNKNYARSVRCCCRFLHSMWILYFPITVWFLFLTFHLFYVMQQPNVCRCAMSVCVGCHCYTPSIQQ